MEPWVTITLAVIGSQALAELVKWFATRKKPKPADKLLVALAQDRIVYVGSACISEGSISKNQLSVLTSIWTPYKEMDGDGMADTIFERCKHLPLKED